MAKSYENEFGKTPAAKALERILENQYPELANKTAAILHQQFARLNAADDIKDEKTRKHVYWLLQKDFRETMMRPDNNLPKIIKTVCINIATAFYRNHLNK